MTSDMNELQSAILDITHVYSIYARAIDEKRFDLLSQVFSADAELHYIVGPHEFRSNGAESGNAFGEFLKLCYWTNHLIGAPAVELHGDRAWATARVQATHLQEHDDGAMSRWFLRGSYHDQFERRDGNWIIVNRYCHTPDDEGEFLAEGVKTFAAIGWTEAAKVRAA